MKIRTVVRVSGDFYCDSFKSYSVLAVEIFWYFGASFCKIEGLHHSTGAFMNVLMSFNAKCSRCAATTPKKSNYAQLGGRAGDGIFAGCVRAGQRDSLPSSLGIWYGTSEIDAWATAITSLRNEPQFHSGGLLFPDCLRPLPRSPKCGITDTSAIC